MITRRNWLLRCSILINIAVLLYICSHVMIGSENITIGPGFVIQADEYSSNKQQSSSSAALRSQGVLSGEASLVSSAAASSTNLQQNNIDTNNNRDSEQLQSLIPNKESSPDISSSKQNQISGTQQQQQLQEQSQQQTDTNNNNIDNNNNNNNNNDNNNGVDDTRFDVPTENVNPINNNNNNNNVVGTGTVIGSVPSVSGAAAAAAVSSTIQQTKNNEIIYQDINYTNSSTNNDGYTPSDDKDLETRLKLLIKCHNKDYSPETVQRGDFWVLKNYVRADHGELRCFESITYTTHADYTFLDNLIPLLERWNAPISIALHAPGTDFIPTLNAIKYLRDCAPESSLVRQFTTFHIYFSTKHIPKFVPKYNRILEVPYNCSVPPPFANITNGQLYKTQRKLLYPVNVGRNIARDAAMTHFILASDIELYPNPGLARKFLEMIARNDVALQRKNPKVFPLSIFEVDGSCRVPRDKTELQELLRTGKAIPFHKRVCSSCHGVPKSKEWMAANETEELGIFHVGKRIGYFVHWEPIYIGTNADPHYDERLSWEGKSDKMTQGYALCVLDYEFQILDNAFLVHKPGIKILKKDPKRAMLAAKTNTLIKKIIYPELQVMYGTRKGCAV